MQYTLQPLPPNVLLGNLAVGTYFTFRESDTLRESDALYRVLTSNGAKYICHVESGTLTMMRGDLTNSYLAGEGRAVVVREQIGDAAFR